MELAPIIVFAYDRPDHLENVLIGLSKNNEAVSSELFVFIDGPKKAEGCSIQNQVIEVARAFQFGKFKDVHIIVSKKNQGLARSIISGVSDVISKYGRVIVLEDDSVPNPYYLGYMNNALTYYENDSTVWSIGGFAVPISLPSDYSRDIIMTQRCSSCAWATWKDRWEKIDWLVKDYNHFRFNFKQRAQFNMWGADRSSMLDDQMNHRINSWAIRFDYAMFKQGMYNIMPRQSLITNIGLDGSGTHSSVEDSKSNIFRENLIDKNEQYCFESIAVDERLRCMFIGFYKMRKRDLFKRYISNMIRYRRSKDE